MADTKGQSRLEQKVYESIIDRSLRDAQAVATADEDVKTKGPRSGAYLLKDPGAAAVDFGIAILEASVDAVSKLVGESIKELIDRAGAFKDIAEATRNEIVNAINRDFIVFAKTIDTVVQGKNHRADIVYTVDRASGVLRGTISGITGTTVDLAGRILEGDNVPYSVDFEGTVIFDEDDNIVEIKDLFLN